MLYTQQARATESSGLVSILIEGPPNAGKTALAAKLAKMSDFPFVKVCSPEDMVGFTESAKCLHIRKVRSRDFPIFNKEKEKKIDAMKVNFTQF